MNIYIRRMQHHLSRLLTPEGIELHKTKNTHRSPTPILRVYVQLG